ncbi:hypothetical protein RI367_003816 [Sorochytrium milnesiophthora]
MADSNKPRSGKKVFPRESQLSDFYGFGAIAPPHILNHESTPASGESPTRSRLSQRSREGDGSGNGNAEAVSVAAAEGGRRSRSASMPGHSSPAKTGVQAVLSTTASPTKAATLGRKRGTYDKVPGGPSFSFEVDPRIQDPLTVQPSKSNGGQTRYVGGDRRLKRMVGPTFSNPSDWLQWKETDGTKAAGAAAAEAAGSEP